MSIYYECYLDIKLDLRTRPDILNWIEESKYNFEHDEKEYKEITKVPKGIDTNSRCNELFYNSFGYAFDFDEKEETVIDTSDPANVHIKYVLGNKNKDYDIEKMLVVLLPYMTEDSMVILWNESWYMKLDVDKAKKDIMADSTNGIVDDEKVEELFYIYGNEYYDSSICD